MTVRELGGDEAFRELFQPPPGRRVAPRPPRTPLLSRAMLAAARLLVGRLVCVQVEGIENIPRGPYLLASNHLSYADSIILPAYLPREPRVYLVGNRHTVWGRWWQRLFVDAFGSVIPVDLRAAFDLECLRRCEQVLRAGAGLVVFPEGDTGAREGELLPLKDGVSVLAQRTGAPIVPVAFSGTARLWLGKHIRVVIGTPFYAWGSGRAAARQVTEELRRRILELMPPYCEDPNEPRRLESFLTNLM